MKDGGKKWKHGRESHESYLLRHSPEALLLPRLLRSPRPRSPLRSLPLHRRCLRIYRGIVSLVQVLATNGTTCEVLAHEIATGSLVTRIGNMTTRMWAQ